MVRSDVLRCGGENSISDGFACPSSTMVKEVILLNVDQNMINASRTMGDAIDPGILVHRRWNTGNRFSLNAARPSMAS
jgi:hypothetical protein